MTKKRVLIKRRDFLFGLGTLAGMGAFTMAGGLKHLNSHISAIHAAERDFSVIGDTPLRQRAAAKGLIYGATSQRSSLASDAQFAAHFAKECGILVPEWELKWNALRPKPDSFDFSKGDWLAKFARTHNMLFRGHTLVWHKSLPQWFAHKVDSQNAESVLIKHIQTVVKHYAGQIHSWDVVNEAIFPDDGRSDNLRKWPWLQFLGPDYIDIAFRAASEADPNALLVYNDHRLDYDTREQDTRRRSVLKLLENLKSRGTPIHALGIQAHLRGDEASFNPTKLRTFLSDVASLGLKILITELDVTDQTLPKDINVRDRMVAGVYEDYLAVVLDEPAVIAVLTWGLSDRYTWFSTLKPRKDKASVRPLPLDAQLERKLAWNAIARAFDMAALREGTSRIKADTAPMR